MTNPAEAFPEALAALDAQLADLLTPSLDADVPRSMTDAALLTFTRVVESLGRRIDAARVASAGEIDDRSRVERGDARLSAQRGCASATELVARLTGVTTLTAKDRLRTAKSVHRATSLNGEILGAPFPRLREAFFEGTIGYDTVTAITRTLGPIAERCSPTELDAAECELVGAAAGHGDAPACGADETRIQAKVWAMVLDPDGALPDYERALRHRAFTLGRERDGVVPFHGAMIPDVAEQFRRLLDAQLSPRVDAAISTRPTFTPSDSEASVHDAPDDPRTRTQKQHDAFAAILGVAARSAESSSIGGAAPTLLVTITASDLQSDDGFGTIDGTETVVPAFVARHGACCGGIQRLIFGDDGRIIELGGPQRVFTAHQRRAITARDGGCVIPGCDVPAAWCEIHHVTEHSRGGPTHTDNGATLCWHHHRTLESSGWSVRIEDGMPQTRAPAWFDPYGRWRPARGSMHLRRDRLRKRLNAG